MMTDMRAPFDPLTKTVSPGFSAASTSGSRAAEVSA